jgi:hypothetical protein
LIFQVLDLFPEMTRLYDRKSSKNLERQGAVIEIALHSAIFLLAGNILPETQDFNLIFLIPGLLLSLPWLHSAKFKWASQFVLGLWLTSLMHICLYENFTRLKFSLMQLYENPVEAWQSVLWFLGGFWTVAVFVEILVTALVLTWVLRFLLSKFGKVSLSMLKPRHIRWGGLLFAGLFLVPTLLLARNVIRTLGPANSLVPPRWLGEANVLPKTDESLIVLQLESLNGSLLFSEKNNQVQPNIDLPGFQKMQQLGASWFPYFWSNAFGTHFGMLNILCGSSGIGGNRLIPPPTGYMCMPERFHRAGFETSYYYSFTQTGFYNISDTVKNAGFQNFLYGKELMQPEDPFFEWGYEDCHFYKRAFDDLKKKGLDQKKKIFVYMSVHMNHFPFKDHMAIKHPFSGAQGDREKYLNSVAEQDHCLGEFIDRVESLNRSDLNVLVVGDHSFPIEKEKGVVDGFTTSLFFLPSKQHRSLFPAGPRLGVRPSHDQIQNTVMELFGADRTAGSFLWSLKGEPPPSQYESCHLIIDFGPGTTLVTEGNEMVVRSLRKNSFTHLSLAGGTPTELGPLEKASDWASVHLKPACLQRLGIAPGTTPGE